MKKEFVGDEKAKRQKVDKFELSAAGAKQGV